MNATTQKVLVASYNSLPVGIGQEIVMGEERIALFRVTNGSVYAIQNRSPHPKGGVLTEGLVSGEAVFCPVYDIKISLVDGSVSAPYKGQVKTYRIVVDGDDVFVELG